MSDPYRTPAEPVPLPPKLRDFETCCPKCGGYIYESKRKYCNAPTFVKDTHKEEFAMCLEISGEHLHMLCRCGYGFLARCKDHDDDEETL